MNAWRISWFKQTFLASIAIISSFLTYLLLPEAFFEAKKRVIAILIFAIFFWGFEIIPLYATSLLLIILLTFLLIIPLDFLGVSSSGAQLFLEPFASPIIMLFLGGLVMASAVHKHKVDFFLMEKIFSKLGDRSYIILGGVLAISAFFSMWISNTAAAAMVLTLVQPLLSPLNEQQTYKKGIILAIAFGANIGGMGTPIGSPPNAIAIGILRESGVAINFINWMAMVIPLIIILLFVTGLILYYFFFSKTKKLSFTLSENPRLTPKGLIVLLLSSLIILMWLTKPLHHIPEEYIALLGVAFFAAFQLITVNELRSIPWDVLILIWGGLALGEAVQRVELVQELFKIPYLMQNVTLLVIVFSLLAILITSFISNTATANILLPIALSIDPANSALVSIAIALACSFSFALPISTPPNALVYSTGLVSVKDMLKSGGTIAIIAWLIMIATYKYLMWPITS